MDLETNLKNISIPEENSEQQILNSAHKKMCLFAEFLLREFDKQITCLEITLNNNHPLLEWEPILQQLLRSAPAMMSSLPYKTIPALTGALGKQSYRFFRSKKQQQRAKELSQLIYQYVGNKNQTIHSLVEACVYLFQSYEMQFVNCYVDENNNTRALAKLSFEAVHNILNHFINEKADCLTVELIIDAFKTEPDGKFTRLVNQFSTTPPSKRTIMIRNKKNQPQEINTSILYSKVGIVDKELYYKTKISKTCKYGYRRLFQKEILESQNKLEENKFIDYNYVLNELNTENVIESILDFIKTIDPKQFEVRIKDEINCIKKKIDDLPSEDFLQKLFENIVLPHFIQNNKIDQIVQERKQNISFFDVGETVFNFVGRRIWIEEIYNNFTNGAKTITITGLGGVGKSELSRKYCEEYRSCYVNIIWIDSETRDNLTDSFMNLANELNIPLKKNNERTISCVVRDVYEKLKDDKSLLIFDNALSNLDIASFLPSRNQMELGQLNIIVTSQNIDWDDSVSVNLLPLEKDEPVELLTMTLNGYIDVEKNILLFEELTKTVGNLPLALQQAAAFIREEIKNGTNNPIEEYLKNYQTVLSTRYQEKLPFPDYFKNPHKKTTFTTMQISFQRLKEQNEVNALKILQICAFLNPEKINKTILFDIYEERIVNRALRSLEKYSLAKIKNNCIDIHRLVLEISRQIFRYDEIGISAYQEVVTFILKYNWIIFSNALATIPVETAHSSFIFKFAEQYIDSLLLIYNQQTNDRKSQLFFLLVYFDCFEAIKKVFESEKCLPLTGYLIQNFKDQEIVPNVGNKVKNLDLLKYDRRYAGPASIIVCFQGHEKILHFLIDNGANINEINKAGTALLHVTTCRDNLNIVKYLLNCGTDKNITDRNGSTVLHIAGTNKSMKIIDFLVKEKLFPIDIKNNFGDTVLHTASSLGYIFPIDLTSANTTDKKILRDIYLNSITRIQSTINNFFRFIEEEFEFNNTHCSFITDISFSYNIPQKEITITNIPTNDISEKLTDATLSGIYILKNLFNYLIENGCDIHTKNNFGFNPFQIAVNCGLYEAVFTMITKGANINDKADDGMCPLHIASCFGYTTIVKLLLDEGANVNEKNAQELTALHLAIKSGCLLSAQILLEKSDVNTKGINGRTALHIAIIQRPVLKFIELLIDNGADINAVDNEGNSSLHLAVLNQSKNDIEFAELIKIVELLIKKGGNINAINKSQHTILHIAIITGRIKMVELLINTRTIDLSLTNINGRTLLHFAAVHRLEMIKKSLENKNIKGENVIIELNFTCQDISILELLLKHNFSINAIDNDGNTPLHLVVKTSNIKHATESVQNIKSEIIKYILQNGGATNTLDHLGISPLHSACYAGNYEIAELLLNYDADINISTKCQEVTGCGKTPLDFAVGRGEYHITELLLRKGADINSKDIEGQTALHGASCNGYCNIVELLLKNKADIYARDDKGRNYTSYAAGKGHVNVLKLALKYSNLNTIDDSGDTLLHYASYFGYLETVQFLIQQGLDINALNNGKRSALHLAGSQNHFEIVNFLLANDADVNLADVDGRSVLHLAVESGNSEIIKLLINNKADINVKDVDGRTVLYFAVCLGHKDIVKLLIKENFNLYDVDKYGYSIFHVAENKKHLDILEYLKSVSQK